MPTNTSTSYPATPELDKMLANKDQSQAIGEFLDWLQNEKKVNLRTHEKEYIEYLDEEFKEKILALGENSPKARELRWNNTDKWEYAGGWVPVRKSIEEMLAEYFKVDLKKCEQERRAVLEYTRNKKS